MKEKVKKVAKGILLYVTLLFLALFIMGIESIEEQGYLEIAGLTLGVMLVSTIVAFKNENIEDYVPSCIR